MNRGFSLIELLLACALLMFVGSAVAALSGPLKQALARSDSGAQLEPAGRTVMETLIADIREAGSGAGVADPAWRLAGVTTRVLPKRDLDSVDVAILGGAIRVVRMPRIAAQAVLGVAAAAGDVALQLDTGSRCTIGPPTCGFSVGSVAVLYTAAGAEALTVTALAVGRIVLSRPLASAFPAGAALSEVSMTTYGTRRAADGSRQLMRVSTGGAEQPMLDNVVDFEVTADTADVMRMTQVGVRLRIEAPSAGLRGPAGYLFRRGGTAGSVARWMPDVELRFVVALRNPDGGV